MDEMKARILITSHDEALSRTRLLILNYNYDAFHVSPAKALASLQAEDCQLLLICHAVPDEEANKLVEQVQGLLPSLPILRLAKANAMPAAQRANYKHFQITFRTEDWLEAVDELLAVAEG